MENRSRVQEIRQRFENATSQTRCANVSKQVKPPLAIKPNHLLNISEPPSKCFIKRSHAFRSDKSKVKSYITAKDAANGKRQFRTDCRLPPINKEIINNSNTISPLSDSLREALKAPLPPGPAPKKPPRTFVHNLEGGNTASAAKMELKEKPRDKVYRSDVEKSGNLFNNNNIKSDHVSSGKPPGQKGLSDKISKEKLLGFIKNFENLVDKKKLQGNNGHIYDSPNGSLVSSENSNSAHVYSEPIVTQHTTEDKTNKINSLHYMSTPIENIKLSKDDSPSLEYLVIPLNKESMEGRKEFDTVLRKTRKMLISNNDHDDLEEIYDDNSESPLADYYAMLPPRSSEPNAKSHDVFDEIKSLMIDAYNNGSVKYAGDGEHSQLKALRGDASSKQLTEMCAQVIKDGNKRFRERHRYSRTKSISSEKLIDALLLIGSDTVKPFIKGKYTQLNTDIPSNIEQLVFPDAANWPPPRTCQDSASSSSRQSNYYTIMLTKNNGVRSFAYCRRLQPEGSPYCLPLTYVILTSNEDSVFYHKILDQIEINHGLPENKYNCFVNDLLDLNFPNPGSSLVLDEVEITRHEDNNPHKYIISNLLTDLSVPVFLKLFSAILLERKIIIVSSNVSKVCDSVEALCKCLYPFSWQHTVVSVLPWDMSEMLQCPTPYLVGFLKEKNHSHVELENLFAGIDNSFVVDADNCSILKSMGDENIVLPKRLYKSLKTSLYNTCPVKGSDSYPSETLLKFFVELVGHYPLVILNVPPGGHDKPGFRVFLRNSFVSALSSKSVEQFLKNFIDTAMFEAFLRERLDNFDFKIGLFEKRCIQFIAEEVSKPSALLKTITLNRTVRVLGDQYLKEM